MQTVARYIPGCVFQTLVDYIPSTNLERLRNTEKIAISVAKSLVDSKTEALEGGKGRRDVMSLLGRLFSYQLF